MALFSTKGARLAEHTLPYRAHGVAYDPLRQRLAVVARRPGTLCDIFDLGRGGTPLRLTAPAGCHFYGHAVFAPDGTRLYTTENAYDTGAGMVCVWDAASGYRRMGQFSSGGVGPHEIGLMPDGATLIVANGGIRTHPETGREKLNLAAMAPSLAYIHRETGVLRAAVGFEGGRLRKLSIRHIAVGKDGTVCAAMQDQGEGDDLVPLVACYRPGWLVLRPLAAPDRVVRRMRGYTGSVALDAGGRIAAVSAPRGNLVTLCDMRAASFLIQRALRQEGCGVAATGRANEFLLTSGVGGAVKFEVQTGAANVLRDPFVAQRRWDNHLSVLP